MKRTRPLTDEQARARLAKREALEARLTAAIEALVRRRGAVRLEVAELGAQLRGQLALPLASTRRITAPARATRAA